MPAPRIPPLPRFATDSVPLATALALFGNTFDPIWTGEEIAADIAPEPPDEDLAYTAFKRVTADAANNPLGEVGDAKPSEAEIKTALRERRDIEFAARRRWKAAAIQFMGYLYRGLLMASATANDDGTVYTVPPRIWGATRAEHLFDVGYLDVSAGQLVVPRSEHPVTVLYPGRPSLKRAIEAEFRRRVEGGEHETTLKAQGEALQRWAGETYPGVTIPTPETIRNQIRSLYNRLLQDTK